VIFTIQRFVEDVTRAQGHSDPDQYAIGLANLYTRRRASMTSDEFLAATHRIRTTFFRSNRLRGSDRIDFEKWLLLTTLDRHFLKRVQHENPSDALLAFEAGVKQERPLFQRAKQRSVRLLLERFRHNVESCGIDMFWESRKRGVLRSRPEAIARDSLAVMVKYALDTKGVVLKEFQSGTGFVDIGIVLSILHIIELKVLARGSLKGPEQLERYLKNEKRREGWLVVVDARPPGKKKPIPDVVQLKEGRVAHVVVIDINPVAPSRQS
jgi:hypothetical protein